MVEKADLSEVIAQAKEDIQAAYDEAIATEGLELSQIDAIEDAYSKAMGTLSQAKDEAEVQAIVDKFLAAVEAALNTTFDTPTIDTEGKAITISFWLGDAETLTAEELKALLDKNAEGLTFTIDGDYDYDNLITEGVGVGAMGSDGVHYTVEGTRVFKVTVGETVIYAEGGESNVTIDEVPDGNYISEDDVVVESSAVMTASGGNGLTLSSGLTEDLVLVPAAKVTIADIAEGGVKVGSTNVASTNYVAVGATLTIEDKDIEANATKAHYAVITVDGVNMRDPVFVEATKTGFVLGGTIEVEDDVEIAYVDGYYVNVNGRDLVVVGSSESTYDVNVKSLNLANGAKFVPTGEAIAEGSVYTVANAGSGAEATSKINLTSGWTDNVDGETGKLVLMPAVAVKTAEDISAKGSFSIGKDPATIGTTAAYVAEGTELVFTSKAPAEGGLAANQVIVVNATKAGRATTEFATEGKDVTNARTFTYTVEDAACEYSFAVITMVDTLAMASDKLTTAVTGCGLGENPFGEGYECSVLYYIGDSTRPTDDLTGKVSANDKVTVDVEISAKDTELFTEGLKVTLNAGAENLTVTVSEDGKTAIVTFTFVVTANAQP